MIARGSFWHMIYEHEIITKKEERKRREKPSRSRGLLGARKPIMLRRWLGASGNEKRKSRD